MTLDAELLSLHGLAVKKMCDGQEVARVMDLDPAEAQNALDDAEERGEVIAAKGQFMLTPKGRERLDEAYPDACDELRRNEDFTTGYKRFERVNDELKQLFTDWQTKSVGGESVPNDHTDDQYDASIVDRLGQSHEDADPIVGRFSGVVPRFEMYRQRLESAHDRALAGEHDYVSAVKLDSYHTVWFELHEDLLRLLGRQRHE